VRADYRQELAVLIGCYSVHAAVYAGQLSLWQELHSNDLIIDVFINLMSAVCASIANTTFRLKNTDIVVSQLFKELLYGIAIGLTAGLITYCIAQASAANKFLQLALVTLSGWGGAKALESQFGKYFGGNRGET